MGKQDDPYPWLGNPKSSEQHRPDCMMFVEDGDPWSMSCNGNLEFGLIESGGHNAQTGIGAENPA
jgi:hypothetical protein